MQLQGVLRLGPGCSVRVTVTRGLAVCACCSRMDVTEREHEMEL